MSEQDKPFAWYWYDKLGCLYITGDDRKPDVPAEAKPLYEHPAPPPPSTHVAGDDWFSQVVSFLVKNDILDAREEYDISDVMAALADNYEPRLAEEGDAIDAIQRLMGRTGLKRKDLFPAKSRASECMSRKLPLSIATIRKLHFEHGIPAEVLISPYRSTEGETP